MCYYVKERREFRIKNQEGIKQMKKLGIGAIIIGIIISFIGITMKIKERAAIGIIGGADGPTSIFVAGRVGDDMGYLGMIFGVVLLIIGIYFILRKK